MLIDVLLAICPNLRPKRTFLALPQSDLGQSGRGMDLLETGNSSVVTARGAQNTSNATLELRQQSGSFQVCLAVASGSVSH